METKEAMKPLHALFKKQQKAYNSYIAKPFLGGKKILLELS